MSDCPKCNDHLEPGEGPLCPICTGVEKTLPGPYTRADISEGDLAILQHRADKFEAEVKRLRGALVEANVKLADAETKVALYAARINELERKK